MSVFDTMAIAASGLTAERFRMDAAASNLANQQSTRTAAGGPYQPIAPVFSAVAVSAAATPGVAVTGIANVGSGAIRVFDPSHPDADAQGFVSYPDVDVASNMADMMGAARSYSMDATVTAAAKQTALDAIEIGR